MSDQFGVKKYCALAEVSAEFGGSGAPLTVNDEPGSDSKAALNDGNPMRRLCLCRFSPTVAQRAQSSAGSADVAVLQADVERDRVKTSQSDAAKSPRRSKFNWQPGSSVPFYLR
jgi:hypothetical protein